MIWLFLGAALAGKGAEKRAAKNDIWSAENLEERAADLRKHVEEASGKSYQSPPTVKLTDDDGMLAALVAEHHQILGNVYSDTPEEVRAVLAPPPAAVPMGVLGKYGIYDKTVYLNKVSIAEAATSLEIEETVMLDLVLSHELVHALHDQVVGLGSLVDAVSDKDGLDAAAGTWEGLAVWVERRVAEERGMIEPFWKSNKLQGWGKEGLVEPYAFDTWASYGQGMVMFDHHFAAGGLERVWEVAAHPPPETRMVFRPEGYQLTRVAESKLDDALRGAEQQLTRGDWLVTTGLLGEKVLRREAVIAGDLEGFDAVFSEMEAASQLVAVRPDREAEIRLIRFADATSSRKYLELLEEQADRQVAMTAEALGRNVRVLHEPYTDVEADHATFRVEQLDIGGGQSSERRLAMVVRGNHVVVVIASRFRPGLRTGNAIRQVFENLAEK